MSEINRDILAERLLDFTVRVIRLVNALPKNYVGKHLSLQLLRSGTSPGANYEEACGAESKADFVHKLGIVLKELKESRFWLRVIIHAEIIDPKRVDTLLKECEELCAIIAKSIITVRKQ
ncbi:MAG: four helix bundle protein [bacterium]